MQISPDSLTMALERALHIGGDAGDLVFRIVISGIAILVVLLIRRWVLQFVESRVEEVQSRYQWAKGTAYASFFLILVFVGSVWFEGLRSMGTFLGLVTAGLAIALKDLVANLAGWVFILWRRPFELGDRIEIDGRAGDVVDIRIFQFTLLEIGNWVQADQSTGRVIHVPNAHVFQNTVSNYTAEFAYIWHEIPVLLTFESDWRRAKEIFERIGREVASEMAEEARLSMMKASRKYLIRYSKLTPVVYTSVRDSGVELTLRFLALPRTRRGLSQSIWEALLDAFAQEEAIDFAYPTYRAYYNPIEGKSEARAPHPSPPSAGSDSAGA